jgi:uncharacterized membrane protein
MDMTIDKTEKRLSIVSNFLNSAWVILGVIIAIVFFYVTTNSTLETHTDQIKEIKTDITDIKVQMKQSAIEQGISDEVIKNLNEKIISVDGKVDKMDEKLDKILMQTK